MINCLSTGAVFFPSTVSKVGFTKGGRGKSVATRRFFFACFGVQELKFKH